jgi:hypothetical protein
MRALSRTAFVPLSGTLKPKDASIGRPSGVAEPLGQLQRLGEDPRGLFSFPTVPRGLGRLDKRFQLVWEADLRRHK